MHDTWAAHHNGSLDRSMSDFLAILDVCDHVDRGLASPLVADDRSGCGRVLVMSGRPLALLE